MNTTTDYSARTHKSYSGISTEYSSLLIERLNDLLANYQVFYQNVRGFHWNITGEKFFELHVKFEELYNDLHLKTDEIAERILTLGGTPLHTFSDYASVAGLDVVKNERSGRNSVEHVVVALRTLIGKQREILHLSAEADDEGTNALMSDYIREQEKLAWMYGSFLRK